MRTEDFMSKTLLPKIWRLISTFEAAAEVYNIFQHTNETYKVKCLTTLILNSFYACIF